MLSALPLWSSTENCFLLLPLNRVEIAQYVFGFCIDQRECLSWSVGDARWRLSSCVFLPYLLLLMMMTLLRSHLLSLIASPSQWPDLFRIDSAWTRQVLKPATPDFLLIAKGGDAVLAHRPCLLTLRSSCWRRRVYSMGWMLSATLKGASVLARISSTVTPSASSISVRPERKSTSKTH